MNKYCSNCGAEFQADGQFCVKCGQARAVTASATAPEGTSLMASAKIAPTKKQSSSVEKVGAIVGTILGLGLVLFLYHSNIATLFSDLSSLLAGGVPQNLTELKTTITPPGSAPITITNCTAGLSATHDSANNQVYHVHIGADYSNTSSKDIASLELSASTTDSFGNMVKTFGLEDSDAKLEAGSSSTGNNWTFDDVSSVMTSMVCSVNKAKYSDGTVWSANPPD